MKTSIPFDLERYKFDQKISELQLQFCDTQELIGKCEFDLGMYGNRLESKKTVKTLLDLKSDSYPGCKILIYVCINLL